MTTSLAFARNLRSAFPALMALALLGTGTQRADAQTFGTWNFNGSDSWGTASRWFQSVIPNGAGQFAIIENNITVDRTLSLNGNRTVGLMILGDNNSTHTWTVQQGSSGSLIFDMGAGGDYSYLRKFSGLADTITAPIVVNDILTVASSINNNARPLILSGPISGAGEMHFAAVSNGRLQITGNNSASTVPMWIYNRGTGNLNSQVEFAATVGNAVGGGLRIGNASLTGNGNAILQLKEGRSNLNQINDSIHVIGDGFNSNARRAFFRLMGGSETVAGITDLGNGLVIENWSAGSSQNTAATLTINGSTDSYIAGTMRNRAVANTGNTFNTNDDLNQGDAAGTPSPYALSLTKSGTSTLTLSGPRIYYTGDTTVSGGTLVLDNATQFRSNIINSANLVINQDSGTFNFRKDFSSGSENLRITGGGSLTKTGNGTLQINRASNVIGALTLRAGTLTFGGSGNTFSSITMDGDHGVNRNLDINNSATVSGNIDLRGNQGQTGSTVDINGTVTTSGAVTVAQIVTSLSGAGGRLTSPSSITMAGAPTVNGALNIGTEFRLNNTGAANNTNRVGDTTVFNSRGGDFTFQNDGSDNAFSETLGALNLLSGSLAVNSSRAGASGTSTLTFAGLNRSGFATVRFTGANVGEDARNRVTFTAGPSLTDGIIGPWATVGNELATYSGGSVTAFTGYTVSSPTSWNSASTNYKYEGGTINIGNGATRTANTVNLSGTSGATLQGTGSTMIVDGGLIMLSRANKTLAFSNLRPGVNGTELVFNPSDINNRLLNVNSTIQENGATLNVVKTGPGIVALNSNNSYTGSTIINEGRLRITSDGSLGTAPGAVDADNIQLNGGVLHLFTTGSPTTVSANRGITVSEAGGQIQVGQNNASTAELTMRGPINALGVLELAVNGTAGSGSTLNLGQAGRSDTYARGIFAVGPFDGEINILGNNTIGSIEMEGSKMTLTGNNTLTGNIRIDAGTLVLDGTNTFGGEINMTGGGISLLTANALGGNPLSLSMGNGRLLLNGTNQTISRVSSGTGATIRNDAATNSLITFDNDINQTFAGTLSNGSGAGILSLTKTGLGMLTLNNDESSFSGVIRIEEGVLRADSVADAGFNSGLGRAASTAADRLVLNGGALSFNNSGPVQTNRSFTLGTGPYAGTIVADGPGRESSVSFGYFSPSGLGNSPAVAFEGSGERTLTLGSRNDGFNTFNLILGDAGVGQATSLRKTGYGQWVLTRPNTYTGLTLIEDGELRVVADGALGAPGGLGTVVSSGRLILDTVNYATDENVFFEGGTMQVSGGTSTFAGDLVLNRSSTVFVDEDSTFQLFGTPIGNRSLTIEAPGTFIMSGTRVASGINLFNGTVAIREGTLILDYTTNNTDKMGGQLQLGGGRRGGTVVLRGGSYEEVVSQLFINSGSNVIRRESGTSSLRLNAINNNSTGNLLIEEAGYTTTDKTNTNGILGSNILIGDGSGGIGWAVNQTNLADGAIVPLTAYSVDNWATNLNVDARNDSLQPAGSNAYTLRFNQPAAAGDVTVTLAGGTNEIQSGGILITPLMGTNHAVIAGPGALVSGTGGATDNLIVHQLNTGGDLVISAPISNGPGTDGLDKIGPGRLVLLGAHPFTGAVTISEGELSIDTLANAGNASGIGASSTANGNLLFNAGTLAYLGESASTDKAFNVSGAFAGFRIGHDRTQVEFSGVNAGGDRIVKEGSGTMVMSGRSTGILAWEVNEGTVEMRLNAQNNAFSSGIAEMIAGGGKLHVIGDTAASRSQQIGGQMTVNAGSTTFQITSVYDSVNGVGRNATLQLQGGEADFSPIRNAGGSVHFIEDSFVDTANNINTVAQILLNIPISERQQVIPWATYKDTALFTRPGVNEFATVDSNVGGVTDASAFQLHDIGVGVNDPNNWVSGDDVSEGIAGQTTFGLGGVGTLTADRTVRTIKYFTPEDSLITIPTMTELSIDQGAILLAYNVRQGMKTIAGDGTLSGNLRAADGSRELLIHNYNSSAPFSIQANIVDGSSQIFASGLGFDGANLSVGSTTMIVNQISALIELQDVKVGDQVSGPGIAPGTTVVAIVTFDDGTGNGVIELSQPATADTFEQTYDFAGKTNFTQAGIGTTILSGNNQFNGNMYVTGGVVRLDSANALPGGIGSSGGTSALIVDGGVVGLGAANFNRPLNTTVEGIQFTGSGGFAAYGADRTVNFGGAGAVVEFGRGAFVPSGSSLYLGSHDATHKVTVVNPIDLGFQTQMIRVDDGPAAVEGELGGALMGQGKLIKGGLGQLRFAVANQHAGGTQLAEGSLRAANVTGVFGTGPVEIGTSTTHTIPESALDLIFEGGSHANGITVGAANATGITSLTSEAATTLSGPVSLGMRTFLQSETGITTTLSGVVSGSGGVVVTSGGQVTLSNAGNAFGSGAGASGAAIDGGTIVRSGSVLVTSGAALGSTTVELGDALPAVITVDRATTVQSVSKLRGEFDATHDGNFTGAGGPGAFVAVSDTIDGRTYTLADVGTRILIMDEHGDPERNGVYEVFFESGQASGTINLVRTGALDSDAELLYGTRVDVGAGSEAGQSFFVASPGGTVNTSPVHFLRDDANANVSLLAGASGLTLPNSIDVNATNGSGLTSIGAAASVTSGTVTFSGPVTLQDVRPGVQEVKQVRVESAISSGLGVILSGLISEADTGGGPTDDVLSLFKAGAGSATLTQANGFSGGVTVDQGALYVNNATGSGTGTGAVTVASGATLGGTGRVGGATTVSGTLAPGSPAVNDGIGTIHFDGSLSLGSGSQTLFTLGSTSLFDRVVVDPGMAFTVDSSASFVVSLAPGFTPLQGDSFDLLDWTTLGGGSDMDWTNNITFIGTSPSFWNLSLLNTQGIITVVPEPGRVGLLLMGLLGVLRRRRR